MDTQTSEKPVEQTAEDLIRLIEDTGLAYIHSSGCAILKDGTWLQPEQWNLWIEHLREQEVRQC